MKKIDWGKYLGWISTGIVIVAAIYKFGYQESKNETERLKLLNKIVVLEAENKEQEKVIDRLTESNNELTKNQSELAGAVSILVGKLE